MATLTKRITLPLTFVTDLKFSATVLFPLLIFAKARKPGSGQRKLNGGFGKINESGVIRKRWHQ